MSKPSTHSVKSIREAVDYLAAQGYQTSRTRLHAAIQEGFLSRQDDGSILCSHLLRHAAATLKRPDHPGEEDLPGRKLAAVVRRLEAQAGREETAAARERGLLIERAQAERELAARALQLRGDFESWAMEAPLRIVERYDLGADAIGEIRKLIFDAGKEWFGRYRDPKREFITRVPLEEIDHD